MTGLAVGDVAVPNGARMYAQMILFALRKNAAQTGRPIPPSLKDAAFTADVEAVKLLMESHSTIAVACTSNRGFLGRSVRYMSSVAGIDQFLDIGCGLPVEPNVHDIAREYHPDARVVYVDSDPGVVANCSGLLDGEGVTTIMGDLNHPKTILDHPQVRDTLDFTKPIGLIVVGVMTFIPTNVPQIMTELREALAPGSHLALSHACSDNIPDDELEAARAVYRQTSNPVHPRSMEEIRDMFAGFRLVDSGADDPIPLAADWRPDPENDPFTGYRSFEVVGGVGELNR
ncbi:SAM-dependent methyltransferase [Streptosporangium sp. NPDC000563]|uniref:SAM-dependent methyltransferase n=1 Tax=Streptosporangium sp. NPDC000563 TaxID=3154366 RepID=UPI003316BBA1